MYYSRPVLKKFGGKYYYLHAILPLLQGRLIEVFGGSGVVIQNYIQTTGMVGVWNDIDPDLYQFMNYIQSGKHLKYLLYSREDWERAETGPVDFYIKMYQSFAAIGDFWSRDLKERGRGVHGFVSALENLKTMQSVWKQIELTNLDWRECLKLGANTYYLDPPYESIKVYRYGSIDHKEMLDTVFTRKERFVVSAYRSELYESYPWDHRIVCLGIENTGQSKVEEMIYVKV